MDDHDTDGREDREEHHPPGLVEGFGSLDADLSTPDIIRDCLRENYVDRLGRADYYKAATRLAHDLKRRSFPKAKALELILAFMTSRLRLSREHIRNIEKAVTWAYEKAERGLSCRGALVQEGLCFVSERACRFHRIEEELYGDRVAQTPNGLPTNWNDHLERVHPTEVWFARMAYGELIRQEKRLHCTPGDPRTPIFLAFRAMSDAVRAREGTRAFSKGQAVRALHLLIDSGLVLKVVQGESGTMRRRANGYVRVLPVPPPPPREAPTSPHELGSSGMAHRVIGCPVPSDAVPPGPSVHSGPPDDGVIGGQSATDAPEPEGRP